jgi:hypothetical protein
VSAAKRLALASKNYLPSAAVFTAHSLSRTLEAMKPRAAQALVKALKEASIIDQSFEQATHFRDLGKAIHAITGIPASAA